MLFASWRSWRASRQTRRVRPRVEALEERSLLSGVPTAPVLYVGDQGDNSVKRFDASTGAFLGDEVAPGAGGLDGPRGLLFENPGQLLVAGQNPDLPENGDVLRYDGPTGTPLGPLVAVTDPGAPFAPRGMVLSGKTLYVADFQGATAASGQVDEYDVHTGKPLGSLAPAGFGDQFNPRGVVFGPDGQLYVSSFSTANPLVGYVFRFDPSSGAYSVVAANNGDGVTQPGETQDLHRPEGLVFGPDGNLYVTSFRANAADNDKVLVFNPTTGALQKEIPLDQPGQPRAFAQALLFGPGGGLYVPITGNGPDTGAVRRYDVSSGSFTDLVAPGTLGQPWYLTFGTTDPATLAYNAPPGGGPSDHVLPAAPTVASGTPATAAPSAPLAPSAGTGPNGAILAAASALGTSAPGTVPAAAAVGPAAPVGSSTPPVTPAPGPVTPFASGAAPGGGGTAAAARGDDVFADVLGDHGDPAPLA